MYIQLYTHNFYSPETGSKRQWINCNTWKVNWTNMNMNFYQYEYELWQNMSNSQSVHYIIRVSRIRSFQMHYPMQKKVIVYSL